MKSSVRLSSLLAKDSSSASGVQSCPKRPLQNGEGWISMVYSDTPLFHPFILTKKQESTMQSCIFEPIKVFFHFQEKRSPCFKTNVQTTVTTLLVLRDSHQHSFRLAASQCRGHTSAQTTPHCERECAADWIIQEKAKIAECPNHQEWESGDTEGVEQGKKAGWRKKEIHLIQSTCRACKLYFRNGAVETSLSMFKVCLVATPILLHNIALIQMCHHAKAPQQPGSTALHPNPRQADHPTDSSTTSVWSRFLTVMVWSPGHATSYNHDKSTATKRIIMLFLFHTHASTVT